MSELVARHYTEEDEDGDLRFFHRKTGEEMVLNPELPPLPESPLPRALQAFDVFVPQRKAEAKALTKQRIWAEAWYAKLDMDTMSYSELKNQKGMNKAKYLKFEMDLYRQEREAERTFPRFEHNEPKWDYQRLKEKLGFRAAPGKDQWTQEMTYPKLLKNLRLRRVSRLMLYDKGNSAVVEMTKPGKELAGNLNKARYIVKIPGDAHWQLSKVRRCRLTSY